MGDLVVMKSYPNGISIHLDSAADFTDILNEVAEKFQFSRKFFKDAKVAISIGGRTLSAEEERQIVQAISSNSDLKVICLMGNDEETESSFLKAIKQTDMITGEANVRFLRGSLKDGDVIESEGSVVIVGDVVAGSSVIAGKDVIIIGSLEGEVYAGTDGDENHFIFSLKMEPQKCKIASIRYKVKQKGLFAKKEKVSPQMLYIKDNQIISEAITKELPDIINMY